MPRHIPPPPDRARRGYAAFIQPDDYTKRFLADAIAAAPLAPRTVAKALYWHATRRYARARYRVQEIVGRRLGFALPSNLRPVAPLVPPDPLPSCAAIVPVRENVSEERLRTTIASVPEGGETILAAADAAVLAGHAGRAVILPGARSLADLVNGAARACDHELLLILLPGNVLLPGALGPIAATLAGEGIEAALADEVLALADLVLPLLKPDFDPDLLLQVDVAGDFLAVRRAAFLALGGYKAGREGALARDFLLRLATVRGEKAVGHVIGPVHGRDLRGGEADDGGDGLAAVEAHLAATGAKATAQRVGPGLRIEIARALADPPPVTVIVPTRDRLDLLVPCLDGLLGGTDYPDLEIIVADNGSSEPGTLARLRAYERDPRMRIAPMPGPFNFSRINNDAVAMARGRVVVFMNNDVEVREPGWLRLLVAEAIRPEVGAVGAKLLYPNDLIQHAGVVLGLRGGPAGYAFHLFRDGHPGYLHMLETTRRCSAVTAACLAIERAKFEAVGGFDAEAFAVALNDVDLCLRLDAAGYRSLHVPGACLLHKESASRPSDWSPDQRARYERELAAFTGRWADRLARDPWYNTCHGQVMADFSVPLWTDPAWPPAP
ncbi:glycosyltransferase family 2 protein [Enterovirga sp.]|uniref:glycosyltransferase family 2 protein n=1 Tax=Enterovirga sp. TaxID=2026350 RepID=UPI002CD8167D|nr:glycosyltransferase family 2 protein [Enterovirga sp.]HMO29088.1 glycosyltransferase family 2 protein [Enterovirga sp.]